MNRLEALYWLAGGTAVLGVGPLAYVVLRQWRGQHRRAQASKRLNKARALVESGAMVDAKDLAGALSALDRNTIDHMVEELAGSQAAANDRAWIGRLSVESGALERYRERARTARQWNERAHAVGVLGKLGMPEAVPTLASVLRDENEDATVRDLAADALASIRDERAVPLLVSELRQVDEQATPRVAEALIRFGSSATEALIAILLDKEHAPARVWAARILAATRDQRAFEALLAGVRDRHDLLRAASADALGAIGDPRALSQLTQVALRDPAPLVRAQAAMAAARIGGSKASDVLIAALGDPDYATRLRALEAFESMHLEDTSPLETALGDSNAEVRRRAALALARLGHLNQLVERLASDDRKIRARAYGSLVQLGRAGVIEGIAGHLRHESMQVRTAIARALGELRAQRVGSSLLSALGDPAWPVRAALCEALGEIRPMDGARALLGMLTDAEESVREAAAHALLGYAESEPLPARELRLAYENGSVPVRLSMVAIAARVADRASDQILIDATKDPSETVRLRAVGALSARPTAAAVPALTSALLDASLEVRMAVVPALGAVGTAESFEALLRTLPGAPPALRERIAEALSGVGRQHFMGNVAELARSELLDVRLGVAWTLGKIGTPECVAVLREFLRDSDASLRASAAGALGKIQVVESVEALVTAVDDRDPKTRAAAVNALGKCNIAEQAVREVLERRLHDPDGFVRNRAGIALARLFGAELAGFASSREAVALLDGAALVIMQGLVGTAETVSLALEALADPARLPRIQRFFDREDANVCTAFLSKLKLRDAGSTVLNMRLDPAALATQYERLIRTSQDGEGRRAAVEALAGIRSDAYVAVFAEALGTDPEDTVRLRCAQVLARFADDPGARSALIRAVSDPHPPVAVAAVESLRPRRDREVIDAFFQRLGAGSAAVNRELEEVLAEVHRDDLTGFVDRTLGTDRPAFIVAAIHVLELMENRRALPLLSELLKSQNTEVRAAAVLAAAKAGGAEAEPLIEKTLDDPQELVRVAALEAIAARGLRAFTRLAELHRDPSVLVRSRLAQLLEQFPGAATMRVLDDLLQDGAARVRGAALITLLTFADVESLRRFSTSFGEAAPDTIGCVRGEARTSGVTRKLAGLLASAGDGVMRELAVLAIAALAVEGYEQWLLPVLHDPRASVRLAAARALATSPLPNVHARLRDLREDPELAVRELITQVGSRVGT